MRTKGDIAGRFRYLHSHFGLEPLAACIYQADPRNGDPANPGGKTNQVVEGLFRITIQYCVLKQGFDALLLIVR